MESFREQWERQFKEDKLKFFVLKAEDVFSSLDREQLMEFNQFLKIIEHARTMKGKNPNNMYWVVNRDEEYADEVKKIIEENEGVEL